MGIPFIGLWHVYDIRLDTPILDCIYKLSLEGDKSVLAYFNFEPINVKWKMFADIL